MMAMHTEAGAQAAAKWLDVLLELPRMPVGIRFLLTQDEYDEKRYQFMGAGAFYAVAAEPGGFG